MDTKESIKEYWHKRSETYDKYPAPRYEDEERSAYYDRLGKSLGGKNLKVLDVGAGTGFISLMLAEMGHDTTGLDISDCMLEKARRKVEESGYRATFQVGDAEKLSFADGAFDAVVSRYLLWTLPNPQQALAEWKRVTKPGGKVICIEGTWSDHSLKGKFKRVCRHLGLLLHDRVNPGQLGYDEPTNQSLPFRDGVTPQKTTALFRDCGLNNITHELLTEIRTIRARNTPFLYRMAMSTPSFIIKGERN